MYWSYCKLNTPIINWNDYRLTLVSNDEAWNETRTTPVNYIWDIVNPVISTTTASGTYFQNSQTINWTSSDLWSWISSVKIQIKEWTNYWDWTNFVAGIQTLNTTTVDDFANWSYDFSYNWTDGPFEITTIAYDKSYKINNISSEIITIIKDSEAPTILWWTSLFTSPTSSDIYIGWDNVNITWNTWSITDSWAGLTATPIRIDYFDWSTWNLISDNEINDWSYIWASDLIDSNNVIIRLSAIDNVWNTGTQNSDSFIIDSTDPSISSVETMDMDANWEIDALTIVMSENITDTTITLWNFNISNWIWVPTWFVTWGSVNDNEFLLTFGNIWDTSLTPTITYTKWSLTDIAWKFLATTSNFASSDTASPRLLTSEMFDLDENWKFDKIISTFSENLTATSNTWAFTINNVLNWITISSVSIIWDEAHVLLSEWVDYDTAVWTMDLWFTSNSNWEDSSNNQAWSIVAWIIGDKANPVVILAEYLDNDSNSKVDTVEITFTENLIWFQNTDFSITWLIKNTSSVTNNTVTIDITETVSDNDTWITADFTFTTWNLMDSSSNPVSAINNYNIEDRVVPKLMSIETWDINWNWKLDNILLTYSEDINSDFATLVWEVDWYNISSYSKATATELIISIDENPTYDSNSTPLVNINSNTSLEDINWNTVDTFALTASTDKVGPVIVWARYDEVTHKIFISSSETINDANFLISNFTLNNAWAVSIDSVNLWEKSITISWETVTYWTTEISFNSNSVGDSLWNMQTWTYFTKLSPPIIINEIMVSDTVVNNYVELRNLSSSVVDISWFTIAWVTIPALTTIWSNWYYLISRDTIWNSIINVAPDLVNPTLNISWASIALNDSIIDIDFANLTTWFADTVTPKSIERKDNTSDWLLVTSWYTAQSSNWFDDTVPFWTPWILNIFDATAPTITNYTPNDNVLLPNWNLNISIDFSDDVWGLGIDATSDTLTLYKWNWSVWWADIAATYIDFPWKTVTATNATYSVSNLEFWKYRIDFSISDNAGNTVNRTIIFYVDQITFNINTNTSSLWNLVSWVNTFSTNEIIITIETVWAWFTIDMSKPWNFTTTWIDIIDWDWSKGFWFDLYNWWYSWNITSMWTNYEIVNEVQNINVDWNKNTYTYRIKYWANIEITQWAWNYIIDTLFDLNTIY